MDREAWHASVHGVPKRHKWVTELTVGNHLPNISLALIFPRGLHWFLLDMPDQSKTNSFFPSPNSSLKLQLTLTSSLIVTFSVKRYLYSLCSSVQFSSVAQSCPTLCDPMNRSTPGLPVHHHLREFTQTHVHRVRDAIQPSHPRSSPSPPAPNPSQHQSLFQWVNSSHEVAKVLEFQL